MTTTGVAYWWYCQPKRLWLGSAYEPFTICLKHHHDVEDRHDISSKYCSIACFYDDDHLRNHQEFCILLPLFCALGSSLSMALLGRAFPPSLQSLELQQPPLLLGIFIHGIQFLYRRFIPAQKLLPYQLFPQHFVAWPLSISYHMTENPRSCF